MSQNRLAHEHAIRQMAFFMKLYRVLSWLFLIAGLLLMLTIIGIPLGFGSLLISGAMFWGRKRLQAKIDVGLAADQEQVEIFEADLAHARKERGGSQS